MVTEIVQKEKNYLKLKWSDEELGFGELSMIWHDSKGRFILDSEHLGVDKVIKIFKSIKE